MNSSVRVKYSGSAHEAKSRAELKDGARHNVVNNQSIRTWDSTLECDVEPTPMHVLLPTTPCQ